MSDQGASPDHGKTSPDDPDKSPPRRLWWRDVVRVVQGDETRSYVVDRLTNAGFSVDSFGGTRKAREIVADALTRVEDRLELVAVKWETGAGRARGWKRASEERAAIRPVRRCLELELWP